MSLRADAAWAYQRPAGEFRAMTYRVQEPGVELDRIELLGLEGLLGRG